jgi:hypothetical protein
MSTRDSRKWAHIGGFAINRLIIVSFEFSDTLGVPGISLFTGNVV